MKIWYSFEPADTLFFRGAEPMVMGESHSSNYIFPPPNYTIEGAIRSYLFKKDKEKFKDFIKVGEEKGGFSVIGPFFMKKETLYIPAPYSWFYDKNNSNERKKIYKLSKIETDLIKTDSQSIYWTKSENGEIESLGGKWIKFDEIYSNNEEIEVKESSFFYEEENHVGIALEKNRKVRKSHIYSFTHSRLKKDVKIVFAVDSELPIDEEDILMLGAEQRFGICKKLVNKWSFDGKGNFYMSLTILKGSNNLNSAVVVTGKIVYLGGWDIAKGFHKTMRGFFPAGTVFNKKFQNCIAIN